MSIITAMLKKEKQKVDIQFFLRGGVGEQPKAWNVFCISNKRHLIFIRKN